MGERNDGEENDLGSLGIEVEHNDDASRQDVERGEQITVDGANFISANSLSALEVFGNMRNGNGIAPHAANGRNGNDNDEEEEEEEEEPERRSSNRGNVVVIGA